MYPVLLQAGPVHIYSLSIFLVLAWLTFSFLFWRVLRSSGIDEDKIFDLTFYATIMAFVAARSAFVATHWELFSDTLLKIVALWVTPGLSWYGALFGGVATLVSMSRGIKVRLGLVLDALANSLPAALIVGLVGAFLDGTIVGRLAELPWALRVMGEVGRRHPVALYEILGLVGIMLAVGLVSRRAARDKRPYGFVGVWFFILYSFIMFLLELSTEARVYWLSLSIAQWVLVAIFAEAMGALYVRGGGRESIRPLVYKIRATISRTMGGIYAKFSKRRSQ